MLVKKPEEGRYHLRDLGVGERILWKLISYKSGLRMWAGFI
jgi:hypothetical protein